MLQKNENESEGETGIRMEIGSSVEDGIRLYSFIAYKLGEDTLRLVRLTISSKVLLTPAVGDTNSTGEGSKKVSNVGHKVDVQRQTSLGIQPRCTLRFRFKLT